MQFNILNINQFDTVRQAWDDLNVQTQNLAILESEFIDCLIEHYFTGQELLAVGYEDDTINTILFLEKVGLGRWQTVMPSQAPLCLWVAKRHNIEQLALKTLANALPGLVLQLDLLQVDAKNLQMAEKQQTMPYIVTGCLPIPDDFNSYFQGLGKNMRQNYNKVINRAKRAEESLEAYCINSPEDITHCVSLYGEIESKSWKAELGTEISPDNAQGRFYQDLMTRFAKRSKACCWVYKINEQIAAVDLCIIRDGVLIILKTTFDEHYAKYSPALQLKVDMTRYYSQHPQANINRIEFFGKAMDWHKRLQSELRDIIHITWFPSLLIGQLKKLLKS